MNEDHHQEYNKCAGAMVDNDDLLNCSLAGAGRTSCWSLQADVQWFDLRKYDYTIIKAVNNTNGNMVEKYTSRLPYRRRLEESRQYGQFYDRPINQSTGGSTMSNIVQPDDFSKRASRRLPRSHCGFSHDAYWMLTGDQLTILKAIYSQTL
ncbi:MAG TPA: hypothetical protein V6D17_02150 [Candidatus Obscuribacterales bacterium]